MIGTLVNVVRNEGVASAWRRSADRTADAFHHAALRVRGLTSRSRARVSILNVAASGTAWRLGGVQAQLRTRLDAERRIREIALLQPGLLTIAHSRSHAHSVPRKLEEGLRDALEMTNAGAVHFDGMNDVPLEAALHLVRSGMPVILSMHDLSLFNPPYQQAAMLATALAARRIIARELLIGARGLVFPSRFLFEEHRRLFALPDLNGVVIEPGVWPETPAPSTLENPKAIAFAGSVTRPKGAHLLPEFARRIGDTRLHVFGGGDGDLLVDLRRVPNVVVHGYHRGGHLPRLLRRHGIGLVILPSVVPEAFSLVLSESWVAGVAVAAFDAGAQAERIHRDGGGWLAPLAEGGEGLADIANRWKSGAITTTIPDHVASPLDSATAHVNFYKSLGLL